MSNLGNKEIFSKNLKKYIDISGKDRKDIAKDLGFSYSTFTDWINGNVYPRIDRIEMLANYFGITKSDLIEEHRIDKEYYLNEDTKQIAQEIFENKELKMLFDATRDIKKEDLKLVYEMVKRMKGDE